MTNQMINITSAYCGASCSSIVEAEREGWRMIQGKLGAGEVVGGGVVGEEMDYEGYVNREKKMESQIQLESRAI